MIWTDEETLNAIARLLRVSTASESDTPVVQTIRKYVENTGRETVWDGRAK